jgi:hypothetical protein
MLKTHSCVEKNQEDNRHETDKLSDLVSNFFLKEAKIKDEEIAELKKRRADSANYQQFRASTKLRFQNSLKRSLRFQWKLITQVTGEKPP